MKKQNLYVFLHGNPGSADDFLALEQALKPGQTDTVIRQSRPRSGARIEDLIAGLEKQVSAQKADKVFVVAYSWGSYFAARWLAETGRRPDKLVLISPTLVVESELSPVSLGLAKTPLVGSLLLNKLAPGLADEFLKKSFAPQEPETFEAGVLVALLNEPVTWKGAMVYKYQHQTQGPVAIEPELAGNTLVIRGTEDASTDWNIQKAHLPSAKYKTVEINGGGHALPWTHTQELAKAITPFLAGRRSKAKAK